MITGGAAPKLLARKDDEDAEEEKGPTNPDDALRYRRMQLQDEKGRIPPDAWLKARAHVDEMKVAQRARLAARKALAPDGVPTTQFAGIEKDSWVWLGPGNIGGRIRSIVIHPTNPNNMWVGSVGGGIWRSTDAGASWAPVDDFLANLAVTTMVIHPTNPNVMYAGTGEGFGNNDAIQGAGIFKSIDGGVSWSQLASTAIPGFFLVNRLAISPDGNTLLAATSDVKDATGTTTIATGGVWRSTDGGATWTQSTFTRAFDLDFRPGDSLRAMVGELGVGRYSLDGGITWTAATFNPAITGRVEMATSPSNPSIVYAAVDTNNGEIYRSNDGGQSFTRVNFGGNIFVSAGASLGWYANAIWISPSDADVVIVGGTDLWRGTYSQPSLPLTKISDWTNPASAHADHHVIVAHPGFNGTTNRVAYFGNDGGLYRANDVSTVAQSSGWTVLNNNLGITQFYGVAGNAASGVIVGGAQDNGTIRYSGATGGWTSTAGGDGGFCAADPTDFNYFYGETQYLGIFRSTDGGASSSSISAGLTDSGSRNTAKFVSPLVLAPSDPDRLFAGGIRLWRSDNAKAATPTWTAIKAALSPAPFGISAIAVSPLTPSVVTIGYDNGDIFLTFSGTSTSPIWTKIDTAALPDRSVSRLIIDHTRSPNWIYATFGGFSADNIYRTTDFGTNWADVTGTGATGLPDVPVLSLVFHPTNSNLLYVGTEVGIFTSDDAGANWEPTQDGPANVSVQELFWMGGDLLAATHGRGIYRASGGTYVDRNTPWNTSEQNGSMEKPFKTVSQGVDASNRYRSIWIRQGHYNDPVERRTINTRVELRSLGGEVSIGTP